ncbi:peptidoglycan-binding domain-containing protein [Streptomyces muensis]|uniref:Peptidoglycan-binding protein LysM n=1 Tax=Streptomyces muensis TaxID=1077944 RepID=A0A9X1PTQ1_STRM4|nr:peptidoglycan-binding protein LysM [Streptomyces muensis]MCF1592369.1 peptidoglycan-binding protein LysM [Streptomyces muensis]
MTIFHAAVVHPDQSVTYCGEVDQAHVDTARALAEIETVPRFTREHPSRPGSVFVLRDDGDLDWYAPVDAEPFLLRDPDTEPPADVLGDALPGADDLPRGATGTVWISGAIRLGDGSIGGAMDTPGNPPRVVHHSTESPAGSKYLESVGSYLIRVASEPQLIYCPVTDRVGQFGPLNQSGRALRNDGTRRTNREGRVCIQIEVLGYAKSPWTNGWDPAKKPGWQKILSAARSWGVPDVFPAGPPAKYPGAGKARSRSVWQSKGGHFSHGDVPGNDHQDPGAISTVKVLYKATAPADPAPTPAQPKVSVAHLVAAAKKDVPAAEGHTTYPTEVRIVEDALVAEGLLKREFADGSFGSKTVTAYAAWQRSKAGGSYTGSAADGVPGLASLKRLAARHAFTATT